MKNRVRLFVHDLDYSTAVFKRLFTFTFNNIVYVRIGYHDSSGKYKKKPPKGMYINHDDVVKLAAIDKSVKQPSFLGEVEREINVLYTTVSSTPYLLPFISDNKFLNFSSNFYPIIDPQFVSKDSKKQAKDKLFESVQWRLT